MGKQVQEFFLVACCKLPPCSNKLKEYKAILPFVLFVFKKIKLFSRKLLKVIWNLQNSGFLRYQKKFFLYADMNARFACRLLYVSEYRYSVKPTKL